MGYKLKRKFSGKVYSLCKTHARLKGSAMQHAEQVRKQGYSVAIIPRTNIKGKKGYIFYTRRRPKTSLEAY